MAYFQAALEMLNKSAPKNCYFTTHPKVTLFTVRQISKFIKTGKEDAKLDNTIIFEYSSTSTDLKGKTIITKSEEASIKFGDLRKEYLTVYAELEREVSQILTDVKEHNTTKAVTTAVSEMMLSSYGSASNVSSKAVSLALPIQLSKYSVADKEFFRWFVRDGEGNMFMKTSDSKMIQVPIDDGINLKVSADPEFWGMFFKAHRADLQRWCEFVLTVAWDPREYTPEEGSLRGVELSQSVRAKIHSVIPKAVMSRMAVEYHFKEETVFDDQNKAQHVLTLIGISPKLTVNKSGNVVMETEEDNWKDVLGSVIANIDPNELEVISRFSNSDPSSSMMFIDRTPFIPSGKVEMPKTWKMFLKAKFETDIEAQCYRLAKFLVSCVDASNNSRQCLILCGTGNNGKTIMAEIIMRGLNLLSKTQDRKNGKFAEVLGAEAYNPGSSNKGLADVFNSMLIYTPDVKDLYTLTNTEAFKNITGQDVVCADIKFRRPIKKRLIGTKIMLTTNARVYISSDFIESRIVPLYFVPRKEGEANWDRQKLVSDMVGEFNDFLKWCFFFASEIEAKYGLKPGYQEILMYSSDNPKADRKEIFERLSRPYEDMFFYHAKDDGENKLREELAEVLANLNLKKDPEKKVACRDFCKAFETSATETGMQKGLITKFLTCTSPERKLLVDYLKQAYDATTIKSHGIRYYKGISYDAPPPKSKSTVGSERLTNTEAPLDDFPDVGF